MKESPSYPSQRRNAFPRDNPKASPTAVGLSRKQLATKGELISSSTRVFCGGESRPPEYYYHIQRNWVCKAQT
jgi:hypothetical protein